jgi:phospholipid-binding lipoprotein MlaA
LPVTLNGDRKDRERVPSMKSVLWVLIGLTLCFAGSAGICEAQALSLLQVSESKKPPGLLLDSPKYPSLSSMDLTPMAPLTPVTAETSSSSPPVAGETTDEFEEGIPDPFEPLNRAAFQFNDKLYFWILKPVATVYKAAVPQGLRIWLRNFFYNLEAPIRVANCLLQGKLTGAGNETARFFLNTTLGFFGCVDQAKDKFGIETQDEDLGQTLGFWGMKPVFYLEVPILGPFSFRDGIGFVGDLFLDPRTYIFAGYPVMYVVRPVEIVNNTSLTLGEYEELKNAAIDPYVSVRDAYFQYRENKIKQ